MFTDTAAELDQPMVLANMVQHLNAENPFRFAVYASACGLVFVSSFMLFGVFFGDGADRGQSELACAKAKLEARWGTPLPKNLEIVGSIPNSGVASADWDLTELGCPGVVYPTATLQLRE